MAGEVIPGGDLQARCGSSEHMLEWVAGMHESIRHAISVPRPQVELDEADPLWTQLPGGNSIAVRQSPEEVLLLTSLVSTSPTEHDDAWHSGWMSVMRGAMEVIAFGGTPLALVELGGLDATPASQRFVQGVEAACERLRVEVSTLLEPDEEPEADGISIGLLSNMVEEPRSGLIQPRDLLLMAWRPDGCVWRGSGRWSWSPFAAEDEVATVTLALQQVAEMAGGVTELASEGGLMGALLERLGNERVGAHLLLEDLPLPSGLELDEWLLMPQDHGFLIWCAPEEQGQVDRMLRQAGFASAPLGEVTTGSTVDVVCSAGTAMLWNLDGTGSVSPVLESMA